MKSKSSFMAVALWILSAAVVAADKPPRPADDGIDHKTGGPQIQQPLERKN